MGPIFTGKAARLRGAAPYAPDPIFDAGQEVAVSPPACGEDRQDAPLDHRPQEVVTRSYASKSVLRAGKRTDPEQEVRCPTVVSRTNNDRQRWRCGSLTDSRSSCLCPLVCRRGRRERLLSLFGPELTGLLTLVALKLVDHPKQRAEDDGAVVAGQIDESSFHDEAAEFNEMPRALAALDLPHAHVMPCPCGLMPVARRPVAPERCQRRGQVPEQIAATAPERTRPRAWPMPPSFRCPSSRPARPARPPVH